MSRTARVPVLVVGDALVEITVTASEPMRPGGDARASISIGPGGQGANVAVRLARRGLDVRLVAALGDDAAGRLLRDGLRAEGVRLAAIAAERTGAVLVTLDASGERSMRSDRVALESGATQAFVRRAASGVGWVHVSGYPLRGSEGAAFAGMLRGAIAPAARLSIAGGSLPRRVPAEADRVRAALAVLRPDLLVLARDEAAALLGADGEPAALAARLAGLAPVAIVTGGAQGAAMCVAGETMAAAGDSDPRPVIDATGAGDAYVGALVAGLADHPGWPPDGATLREAAGTAARAGAAAARVHGAQGAIDGERVVAGEEPG